LGVWDTVPIYVPIRSIGKSVSIYIIIFFIGESVVIYIVGLWEWDTFSVFKSLLGAEDGVLIDDRRRIKSLRTSAKNI